MKRLLVILTTLFAFTAINANAQNVKLFHVIGERVYQPASNPLARSIQFSIRNTTNYKANRVCYEADFFNQHGERVYRSQLPGVQIENCLDVDLSPGTVERVETPLFSDFNIFVARAEIKINFIIAEQEDGSNVYIFQI